MSRLAGAIMNSLADAPPVAGGSAEPKAQAKGKAAPKAKQLARVRSRIDLDDDVEHAKLAAKEAKKQLRKKVTDAKLARKKKMRLVTKASKLPSDDLYRIALYKRVNIMNAMMQKDTHGAIDTMLSEVDSVTLESLITQHIDKRKQKEAAERALSEAAPVLAIAAAGGEGSSPSQAAPAAANAVEEEVSAEDLEALFEEEDAK